MTQSAEHRNVVKKHFCPACDHFHRLDNSNVPGAVGVCLFRPPIPFVVGMGTPVIAADPAHAQMIPIIRAYFAPVGASDTCSQWTPRPAGEA